MMLNINRKKWIWIVVIGLITALIPIVITAFELMTTNKNSVVFLDRFPTSIGTLILLYYLLLIVLGVAWFIKQIIALMQLKNERKKAELLHLKNQVNPHFFFNTLNNLYGLVGSDSVKAQKLILKLSDMMRYSIYEGENDLVLLKKEIDFLTNYIDIHKMRYHKEINVQFNLDVDGEYKVLPLLFIILLENAFKHGIENLSEDAYIYLSLKTENNKVYFEIENNFDKTQHKDEKGIGLANLKRRLELVYPQKHSLNINTTENVYKAQLTLDL